MVKRKLSGGQYWEIIVVVTIILVVVYRVLVVYDFIPDEYQPANLASSFYMDFKKRLQIEAALHGSTSKVAQQTLDKLNAIETYLHEKNLEARRSEMIADRCQENSIFRFFMYMGDKDPNSCTDSNMRTQQAIKEIQETAHPGSTTTQPIAPSIQPIDTHAPVVQSPTPSVQTAPAPMPLPVPQPTPAPTEPATAAPRAAPVGESVPANP